MGRDTKQKKIKTGQNKSCSRSRAISSSCGLLNTQATEAVGNGKIWESTAFDFQHGYLMWTWFVNFLDKNNKN